LLVVLFHLVKSLLAQKYACLVYKKNKKGEEKRRAKSQWKEVNDVVERT
jgi:hypothetical protein